MAARGDELQASGMRGDARHRRDHPLPATEADIRTCLERAVPGATFVGFHRLTGGVTNTTFGVRYRDAAGGARRAVLRMHQRGGESGERERRIGGLLQRAGVPHPRVLGGGAGARAGDASWTMTAWVPGTTLDRIVDPARRAGSAAAIGRALAQTHAVVLPVAGRLRWDLSIDGPFDFDANSLVGFCAAVATRDPARGRLGADRAERLIARVRSLAPRLEAWAHPPCLVHGDCNASNIVIARERGQARATLLDWEFALSAHPMLDFGALLRGGLAGDRAFQAGLAQGYRDGGSRLPDGWAGLAAIGDLFAWLDLLGQPDLPAAAIADARDRVGRLLGRTVPRT